MRNLEDLIKETSGTGLSQAFIIIFVSLTRVCVGWSMLSLSFANFVPKWCCLPDNLTAASDEYCHTEDHENGSTFAKMCLANGTSCSRRVFAAGVRTIIYEWDLVCERKWMVPLTTSVQMTGLLFGCLFAGQMSDLLGRKKTVYFFTACCPVFNFIAAFSTSWEMFSAAVFLAGATHGGFLASSVPYISEFTLPSRRAMITVLPTFNIGVSLMALAAWRLQDYTIVYWTCGVMMIPLVLPYFFLPESLRWLTVKGRVDDAQRVVEWIARWNKQQVPKDSLDVIKAVAAEVTSQTDKPVKYTYIHIYKGWHLVKTSLIIQYLWFTISLCSYGFSFGASSFGVNVYLTICLMSLTNMPSFIVVSLAVRRLGCKVTAILFLILASVCGFASLAVKLTLSGWDMKVIAEIVLNVLSRGFVACAWSATTIFTNETYPTVIRGLGFGAANVSARVGAMLSPFLLNFEDGPTLALCVVGGSLLIAAFTVTFLQETSGKALAESISVVVHTVDKKTKEQETNIYVIGKCSNTNSSLDGSSSKDLVQEQKL